MAASWSGLDICTTRIGCLKAWLWIMSEADLDDRAPLAVRLPGRPRRPARRQTAAMAGAGCPSRRSARSLRRSRLSLSGVQWQLDRGAVHALLRQLVISARGG